MDQQYVRRFRQHIPFYKSNFPNDDRRIYWHHMRKLCDHDCIFGIPVLQNQFVMFVVEDPSPTDITIDLRAGQGSTIYLCCLDEGDADACTALTIADLQGEVLFDHTNCVIDGEAKQFNYFRFKVPSNAPCGVKYFKIIAYEGTDNERIFYSQPIEIFDRNAKMYKLNINDDCGIGGVIWSDVWEGWPSIDGYEVYLPEITETAFIEHVQDEEVEEDGHGNERQIYASLNWKYQFDTGLVPDHFAEIIAELKITGNNHITFPDDQAFHYVALERAETTMTPDNDGCFMQVSTTFLINKYTKDACCATDICECPQDNAIQVLSYITDQTDAEIGVVAGDKYIVPNGAGGPNNPDWGAHDNKIATWDGADWVYEVMPAGSLALTADTSLYYVKGSSAWILGFMFVASIVDNAPVDCTWTVTSIVAAGVFAKLQVSVTGSGIWTDSIPGPALPPTGYLPPATHASGIQHYTPLADNYDLRLVALDTGCNIPTGLGLSYIQVEVCA